MHALGGRLEIHVVFPEGRVLIFGAENSTARKQKQDLKLAQEMLGHARLSTTADIYLHSGEKGAKQATELLAKLLLEFCPLFAHSEGQNRSTVQ